MAKRPKTGESSGNSEPSEKGPGGSKLGEWKVTRLGETQVALTLPEGMVVTSEAITIEDILQAIATHNSIKQGRVIVRCCGGATAIA